jgi:hypothetical protein
MIDEAHYASCSFVSSISIHRVHTAIKISGVNSAYEQTTGAHLTFYTCPLMKTVLTFVVAAQGKTRPLDIHDKTRPEIKGPT